MEKKKQKKRDQQVTWNIERHYDNYQPLTTSMPTNVPERIVPAHTFEEMEFNDREQQLAVYQNVKKKGIVSKTQEEAQENIKEKVFPDGE